MHILVNAIPLRPGGGLTVLMGVLQGLREANGSKLRLTVVSSCTATKKAVLAQGAVDRVDQVCQDQGVIARALWQKCCMNRLVQQEAVDSLLTINYLVPRLRCHQVVYHLDLSRFVPIPNDISFKDRFFEKRRDHAARNALMHATANVFESSFLREAASRCVPDDPERNHVIYIGVPDDIIDQAKGQPVKSTSSVRIAAVTNPLPHKDNPTMIRAFASLVHQCPELPWTLEIAGGGDAKAWQPYQELAKELQVFDRITWHGYLNSAALDRLLRDCLCLLSTSVLESFCMVAVEAMARGCPPIVSDVTSMPESVGQAGVLVPPGDVEGFASAIRRLYLEPLWREELIGRGLQHIDRFRWSKCGSHFTQIFENLNNQYR